MAEVSDSFGRDSSTSDTSNRWHPWIIPSAYKVSFNQLEEFPLAKDCEFEVKSSEFVLSRLWPKYV